MRNGWVKLHRGLLEHGIFKDADVLQVWMYLLLRASYREQKLAIGRQVIALQPGQLLYGRKAVSEKLGMGEGKLRGIMEMLLESGSIMVESTNRYSVVTIVNWLTYQQGESEPEFPFDVDFFEDDDFEPEYCRGGYYPPESKPEPTDHQPETLSGSGFAVDESDDFADFQPTENHIQEDNNLINNKIIKKYKIKKRENNKTEKNKENKKEKNKKTENTLNQENIKTQEHHYRQSAGVVEQDTDAACDVDTTVTENTVGGESVIKGESVPERRRFGSVKDSFSYADTLAACEDAELEAYFAGSLEGVYDDDLLAPFTSADIDAAMLSMSSYQPRHEFTIEMRGPNEPLTHADLNQLEQLYLCAQNQDSQDIANEGCSVCHDSACEPSGGEKTVSEEEQELAQARDLFDKLWELYPKQLGYRKVSDAQKLKLYRTGYDVVAKAVRNYKQKKRRIRRDFWMNGSTFFNGGFLDYLPECA